MSALIKFFQSKGIDTKEEFQLGINGLSYEPWIRLKNCYLDGVENRCILIY